MPLVRCSCVSRLVPSPLGVRLDVVLPDPGCDYVVHRIGPGLAAPSRGSSGTPGVRDAIDG